MEENSALLLNEDNVGNGLLLETPKSHQNDTGARRWASVVKAHKNILNSPEITGFALGTDETLEFSNCLSDIMSENYENHRGFITFNKNTFFCQICSLDLDTMMSLTNHLKTRKHEDNVIVFLKNKLPVHLEYMMEFVSFCKSELCCNLCQETIDMFLNPHETLLNIIAHNLDTTHASLRASHQEHSLALNLLNILSETHPEIMKNMNCVEKTIYLKFKCKLCDKNIGYNENVELLERHFISHFQSRGHVKNQKAVEVLKLFDEVSISGKGKFIVINGNILCTVCNCQVDTDVEKLILHVKGVEHTSHSLANLKLTVAHDVDIKEIEENKMSVKKSYVFNEELEKKETKKEDSESKEKVDADTKLNKLISALPVDLRQIDCLIENDRGSVTCLICNCFVPPCKHNLVVHLNGNNHQRKAESRQVSTTEENGNQRLSQTENKESKFLLQSLRGKLGSSNCIVSNVRGGLECLVCRCDLPLVQNTIEEHLRSPVHVKKENRWMKKCPSCPSSSTKFIKEIPKDLRNNQCKCLNTIVAASIHDNYDLLLKKHPLISNNKDLLVINLDGKHCYCKLCKSLIPLSLNISDFEKNLVSHFIGKTHTLNSIKNFGMKLEEVKKTPRSSSSGKVARSLFAFSSGDEIMSVDTKVNVPGASSSFEEPKTNRFSISPQKKMSGASGFFESFERNKDSEVFIFGKSGSNEQYNLENLKNKNTASKIPKEYKALPVSRTTLSPTFEIEADEAVLSRRQKQLDYGKNTQGYVRYRKVVSMTKRRLSHPMTPPKHLKCSRRTWDGMVKVWRKKLHAWDLPQDKTTLEKDIQPLPVQNVV